MSFDKENGDFEKNKSEGEAVSPKVSPKGYPNEREQAQADVENSGADAGDGSPLADAGTDDNTAPGEAVSSDQPAKGEPEEENPTQEEPAEQEPAEQIPVGAWGKFRAALNGSGCLKWAVYGTLILLCSVLIAMAVVSAVNDMTGAFKPDKAISVSIPKGAGNVGVARVLKKSGVIGNSLTFRIYLRLKKVSGLKYGTFALNSDMGYADIVAALKNPGNNKAVISVTIPEGYTLMRIANVLEQEKVCGADDFINALENDKFNFSFDSSIPDTGSRYYKYEGYLFPDTYGFYLNEPAQKVAQIMLSNFEKKVGASLAAKAKAKGFTFDQMLTLASIIQIESSNPAHMREVSSVFNNRLSKGTGKLKFLQSDSTYFYVQNNLQNAGEAIQNAYDTYDSKGLPPGPICNPGLDAMNAAINPVSTNYYYFVTDNAGNYYFAVTQAQHNANVAKTKAASK